MERTPQPLPPSRALHPSMRSAYSSLRARSNVQRHTAFGDLADVAQHESVVSPFAPAHTPTRSYVAPGTCTCTGNSNANGGRVVAAPRGGPATCPRSGQTRGAAYHYTPNAQGGSAGGDVFAAEFFQRVHHNGTVAATVANELAQSVAAAALAQDTTNAADSCSPSPSSVQTNPQFVNVPSISPARLGTMSVHGHDTLLLTSPACATRQEEGSVGGANAVAALEARLAHATRGELLQLVLELSAVSSEAYDVAMHKSAAFLFRHDLSAEFEREGRLLLLRRQMSGGEAHGGQRAAYADCGCEAVEATSGTLAAAAAAAADKSGMPSNLNNVTELIECFTNPHTNSSLLSERFSTMQESTTTMTTTATAAAAAGMLAPHVLFANTSAQGGDGAGNMQPRRGSMAEQQTAYMPFRSTPRAREAWPATAEELSSAKRATAAQGPDTAPPYGSLDTVAASEREFVAARHPCLRWYGGCRYPTRCIYVSLPQNVCLNWLYGACTAGSRCVGVHRLPDDCPAAVREFYALHHGNDGAVRAAVTGEDNKTPSPLAKTTTHASLPRSAAGVHKLDANGACAASQPSSPHTPGDQIMRGTPPPLVLCECPSPHPHTDALLAGRRATSEAVSRTRSGSARHKRGGHDDGSATHPCPDAGKGGSARAARAAAEQSCDEAVCRCLVNSFDRVASPRDAGVQEDDAVLGSATRAATQDKEAAEGGADALVFGEPCATQASSPLLQTTCSYATLVYDEGRAAMPPRRAETSGANGTKDDIRCGSPELRDYTRSQSPAS